MIEAGGGGTVGGPHLMAEPGAVEAVARRMDSGGILLRRWFGAWVDFISLVVVLYLPGIILRPLMGDSGLIVGGLAMLAYFPVTEGLWGRSAGKFASGTIVVDRMGRPPGIGKAALRTLLRLIEVNPFLAGGLPAGIIVLNTKERQRLGDMAAGTYVIPMKEYRTLKSVAGTFD
jgi:uncharacterized RDD family membrane protein YckC